MKIKASSTYKLRQVLFITLFWVLIGMLMELHNAVNYDPQTRKHFLYFIFGPSVAGHLLITAIGPLIGGLVAGSFIVFYQREKLRGKTYGQKLLIHSALYLFFLAIFIGLVGLIGALYAKPGVSYWDNFYNDIFSLRVLRLLLSWYVVVTATVFLLDISERHGAATLKRILLGKYHSPGKEERIFMFLDLRGSTRIAESIGDARYFRMLHFFFQVANEAILACKGEIYQYVGDEIVISWERKTGLLQGNCLRCFYAVQEAVQQHADYFQSEFSVVPQFKAGVHSGTVVTGEIGTIKRDIVYSGDVLNTSSRIVGLCNSYQQDLLVSGVIYEPLKDNPTWQFRFLGHPELRGKSVALSLYGVQQAVH